MRVFSVVLVPFPFTDLSSSKRRPCLVLASFRPRALKEHIIVGMMTSQVDSLRFPHDLEVSDLESAGLPKPTIVRLSKLVTIDTSLIVKELGRLSLKDQRAVSREFGLLFKQLI
jgi:mRNA interferase MazF